MNADRPADPTKLGPVATQRLERLRAVAQALPGATREEIVAVQGALPAAPPDAAVPAFDRLGAAPRAVPEPVQEGKPLGYAFVAALERAKAVVPVPEPPPALLGDQPAKDPRGAQAARELEARLQTWSNHTLAVIAALLAEYEPLWQRQPGHAPGHTTYRPRLVKPDGDIAA